MLQWPLHELHRFLPTRVFKKDDGPVASLFEVETYRRAHPFFRPVDHLPQHAPGGIKFKNLHVETAVAKAKPQHAAGFALPLRIARPPRGQTFDHGQCLIDIIHGRRFDSDFVQNIGHIRFLFMAWC